MFQHLIKIPILTARSIQDIIIVGRLYDQGFVNILEVLTNIPEYPDPQPILRWYPGDPKPSRSTIAKALNGRSRLVSPREAFIITPTPKLLVRTQSSPFAHRNSLGTLDEQYLIGLVFRSLSNVEQDLWRNITDPVLSEVGTAIVYETVLSFNCRDECGVVRLHELCKKQGLPYRVY